LGRGVCATEVSVTPSAGNHESGSSKVKVHNIVDYTWEERFHTGQLLAVHMGGVLIAYGIKAINKTVGVVRVVNRKTDERALIKGMEGAVQDIAFAHIPKEVILACVDHNGNLFVYRVIEDCKFRLTCELQLHILPDDEYVPQTGDFYRVIWCPFIPELPDEIEEEDVQEAAEDVAWLLALSRGKKMELWNIKMVTKRHSTGPVKPGMVKMGYLEINEHQKPIVDAAFAPDGTAIATASLDGEIKFFQVYMQNGKKPRCLHQWQPHGGEPLSSLFFLDNHKNYNPDIQFWKFAITGAKNNSELKVWSCESWTCLQTLAFKVRPDRPINLNASLDLASGYLLLSDFHHKILYVLQLYTNNSETSAAIISISEFLLPYPILSFGIVDAGIQRFKSDNLEEICNDENDEESVLGILVRMYLVQPKSLQDCQIAFIPPKTGILRQLKVRKNEEQTQMRRSVNQAEASGGGDAEVWKTTQRLETSVSSMIHITNSLLQAFEEQAAEVKQLREEIRQQNMLREMEKIISHNSQQQMTILEKILASKENKHQQEALASAVSQSVINFLNSKVFESVNKEISSTVVPAVNNQIESLKHQIHVEIDQKLSATDHLLKENITKLVHSKSVMDVLSAATVSSLTPVISQCYKEYFTNVALPSFEKSCSTMFNQINEIFSKGSKEFVTALDAQSQRVAEKNREQSVQLQGLSDVLKNCTMQMNNELKKSVAGIEKQVMDAVTSALTLQQAALEGSMFAAVRSRSVTPAPHIMDTKIQQSQILQLVTQGQINTAFQQALSASDLNLVVFVCEKVNPQQLFSQSPCPLQQHVLLSLVQQLSADMNNHTDIKHKYLEEALMNLDIKNSMTREHIPVVLNNLQRQLQAYIANNPNNRITRSIKLLLL
ncbi:LOW QUALITY PROTEIN: enhancer of mRNA-decapping protein 4-like, partial [Homalodisca vitripennis]|uniref:LOW QUALITY PROTEIN: enhancer of mRNA-decapping protein 4-like n=1 Tax=Homalodisca vitripennis TaxID=197043 RepID=UPI001EEB63AA